VSTETAIVQVQPSALAAYEPRSIQDAYQLAKYFAESRLMAELGTPERVLLIMATGAELGIPATAALRGIHIIKGKPSVSADLKVALVMRSKECEYFRLIETTSEQATYETKRRGSEPIRMTFTIADARRAKLAVDDEDSNWSKYRPAMLRHRCSSELSTAVYPDVVLGLPTTDEMEEVVEVTPPTTPPKIIMEADLPGTSPPVNPALDPASVPKVEKAVAVTAATEAAATDAKPAESADDKAERLIEVCKTMTVANKGTIRKEGTSLPKGSARDKFIAAYSEALKRLEAEQKATSAEAIK
jgi:hypothetical protein